MGLEEDGRHLPASGEHLHLKSAKNDNPQSNLTYTAGHFQTQTIRGVFMFGSVAQGVTKTKSSLSAVQRLPGRQHASEARVKATKKPVHWSTIGKFKVDTKKTQEISDTGGTTRR